MKRALVAALAAALTTAAVLSASGIGATTSRKAKSRSHHAYRAGASGATGAQGARPTGPPPTMAKVYADMQARREAQDKKLADALGVSVDKLHSAFDAVQAKRLADDVAANRLTQAQADAIKACKKAPLTCDHSNLPAFGGHRGPGGMRGPGRAGGKRGGHAADLSALATELGVSTDKLKSALQANRPQGPGFGGPGGHMPGGDGGPHGGGMPGPPMGGMGGGGPHGGSYDGAPASTGTDA